MFALSHKTDVPEIVVTGCKSYLIPEQLHKLELNLQT